MDASDFKIFAAMFIFFAVIDGSLIAFVAGVLFFLIALAETYFARR